MNLLLFLIVASGTQNAAPIEARYSRTGYLTLPVVLDGKSYRASIEPGALTTAAGTSLNPGTYHWTFPGSASKESSTATFTVATAAVTPGSDVSIGYDILKHGSVGIDIVEHKLYYWPDGIGPESKAIGWISLGNESYLAKRSGVEGVTLATDGHGRPAIPATIKGKSELLRMLIADHATVLTDFPEGFTDEIHFGYGVKIGSQSFSWITLTNVYGGKNPFAKSPFGGSLSVENFYSARVLYDFRQNKLYFDKHSPEDITRIFFNETTRFYGIPSKEQIVLGGSDLPAEMKSIAGARITDIAGISSEDIVKALYALNGSSASLFAQLYVRTLGNYEAKVRLTDGTEETYSVAAAP